MGCTLEKMNIRTLILFIGIALTFSACVALSSKTETGEAPVVINATPIQADTAQDEEDGKLAIQYLTDLAGFGSRSLKNAGHGKAVDYIKSTLKDMGYSFEIQKFVTEKGLDAANIIVDKAGKSGRQIIVGAHYDSVATGSGVDDNGSGVAMLLEMAKRLKDRETPYSLHFIFFDAEETGLEGSEHYAVGMSDEEIQNTAAMINLDSLAVGDQPYIYGNEGKEGVIREWALAYVQQQGIDLITQTGKNPEYPAGTTVDESDHAPFLHRGIQYAYFEATNWDLGDLDGYTQVDPSYGEEGEIWHTPFDTVDYITKTFPGRMESHLKLFSNVLFHILTEYHE
jgi:Zn-dependent M28 family amino/carboxypeptidase